MANLYTNLNLYQSGDQFFISISDEDALKHSKTEDWEEPEMISEGVYLSEKVLEAFKEFLKEDPELKSMEEDGGMLCSLGLYKILEGETDGVIEHYSNAENPAKALELCMAKKESPLSAIVGGEIFARYPGYIVAQLDSDASYTRAAILEVTEGLKL